MEFEFDRTVEDFADYAVFINEKENAKRVKTLRVFSIVLVAIYAVSMTVYAVSCIIWVVNGYPLSELLDPAQIVLFLFALALCIFLLGRNTKSGYRNTVLRRARQSEKNGGVHYTAHVILNFTDDSMRMNDSMENASFAYAKIQKIYFTEFGLCFMLDKQLGIYIPKRAYTEETLDALHAFLQGKIASEKFNYC